MAIAVEEFAAQARAWLTKRYPSRPARTSSSFVWGESSDDVSLFEEIDPAVSVDEVAAVRAWRSSLQQGGYAWITGPPDLGGAGLSIAHQRAFDEAARDFDVPGNRLLLISLGMVAPTILDHGADETRRRYLPELHAGRLIACQLFSEPGAGSDLRSVSTRATADGGGWRLTGQKVWTSGAHFSDLGLALCRTSNGDRASTFTMFLVDLKTPGVEIRPLRQMTGGAAFNEVFLDDVYVPDTDRLGSVGDGWRVMRTTLTHERASVGGDGFGGVGLLSPARYLAMARALGRSDDPVVRQELAQLVCTLRVARFTSQRAAANRRAGKPGPEGSFTKLALSRNYQRISDLVSLLLGPSLVADTGAWGTYRWAAFVLGAPGMRIGGGTDEVLLNAIAERELGLPR